MRLKILEPMALPTARPVCCFFAAARDKSCRNGNAVNKRFKGVGSVKICKKNRYASCVYYRIEKREEYEKRYHQQDIFHSFSAVEGKVIHSACKYARKQINGVLQKNAESYCSDEKQQIHRRMKF